MLKKRLKTAPVSTPVDIAAVKENSRIEHAEHDALLGSLIGTATSYAERAMDRLIMPQVWECFLDGYQADWFELPVSRVRSVVGITYTDVDGNTQTLAAEDYELDNVGDLSRLRFVTSFQAKPIANAVFVELNCGYADADSVPEPIKQAVTILTGHLYENPTGVAPVMMHEVPASFDALLDIYKIYR